MNQWKIVMMWILNNLWWWICWWPGDGVLEVSTARSKLDGVLQTLVEKKDEGFVLSCLSFLSFSVVYMMLWFFSCSRCFYIMPATCTICVILLTSLSFEIKFFVAFIFNVFLQCLWNCVYDTDVCQMCMWWRLNWDLVDVHVVLSLSEASSK